jgi:hypothetical protein
LENTPLPKCFYDIKAELAKRHLIDNRHKPAGANLSAVHPRRIDGAPQILRAKRKLERIADRWIVIDREDSWPQLSFVASLRHALVYPTIGFKSKFESQEPYWPVDPAQETSAVDKGINSFHRGG